MAEERQILLVSKAGAPWLGAVRAQAKAEGWPLSVHAKTLDALTWLDQNQPRAIVLDGTVSRALTLCVLARAKALLADVPILGLVPVVDDASFSRWLAVGVDDVLPATAPSRLAERLRAFPLDRSIRPPPDRGLAVVADTDPARCDVVGRVLAYAGYDVRLALDAARLVEYASEPEVQLVIASTAIGEPNSLIQRSRKGATLPAWVVGDPALEPWANPRPFSTVARAVVMSARAQPDAVLFASNALLLACGRKARGSTRLLYGTTVAFRVTGKVGDECGYTFNISATGLFVRTLASPPPGDVTLELEPPGTGVRQKFQGEVIWNQPFGNQPGATTPPGFGVRLLDESTGAMNIWREAYRKLAETSGVPPIEMQQPGPKSVPGELAPAVTKLDAAKRPKLTPPKPPLPRPGAPTPSLPKPGAPAPPLPKAALPSLAKPATPPTPLAKPATPPPPLAKPATPPLAKPATPPLAKPATPHPPLAKPATPHPPLAKPATPHPPLAKPATPEPSLAEPAPPTPLPSPELEPILPEPLAPEVVAQPAAPDAIETPSPRPQPMLLGTATDSAFEVAETSAAPDIQGAVEPPRKRGSWPLILSTVVLAIVAIAVGGWVFVGEDKGSASVIPTHPRPEPEPPATVAPAATPLPSVATAGRSAEPMASTPPPASASAQPPAASASAAPPVAPANGACPEATPGDGPSLLTYEGYLIVCSSASLDVYASGVLLGKTNEKLVARCHLKFVRLGEGSPATWRSDGTTVDIACRDVTRVTIDPTR